MVLEGFVKQEIRRANGFNRAGAFWILTGLACACALGVRCAGMVEGLKCKGAKADGSPCGAYATAGGEYCFAHDPSQAAAAAEARSKGGEARAAQLSGATVPGLTTAAAVRDYLGARAIAALCRIQLAAIEQADKERRAAEAESWMPRL